MNEKGYLQIVEFCEDFLARHGDSFLGVGWTKRQEDADTRYRLMLEVMDDRPRPLTLLDFGCGASHLYEYLQTQRYTGIQYSGLDISPRFLELSRRKHPEVKYYEMDVLEDDRALPTFDYVVMNGVCTAKCAMSTAEMMTYVERLVTRVFAHAHVGLAFNVMSKQVDWERDDLFHLSFDALAGFLTNRVSRHFVIRHDYGLYEYTVYVYRNPR